MNERTMRRALGLPSVVVVLLLLLTTACGDAGSNSATDSLLEAPASDGAPAPTELQEEFEPAQAEAPGVVTVAACDDDTIRLVRIDLASATASVISTLDVSRTRAWTVHEEGGLFQGPSEIYYEPRCNPGSIDPERGLVEGYQYSPRVGRESEAQRDYVGAEISLGGAGVVRELREMPKGEDDPFEPDAPSWPSIAFAGGKSLLIGSDSASKLVTSVAEDGSPTPGASQEHSCTTRDVIDGLDGWMISPELDCGDVSPDGEAVFEQFAMGKAYLLRDGDRLVADVTVADSGSSEYRQEANLCVPDLFISRRELLCAGGRLAVVTFSDDWSTAEIGPPILSEIDGKIDVVLVDPRSRRVVLRSSTQYYLAEIDGEDQRPVTMTVPPELRAGDRASRLVPAWNGAELLVAPAPTD
jgi:hypothetical protein